MYATQCATFSDIMSRTALTIRLPESLLSDLKSIAEKVGVTKNAVIVTLLRKGVEDWFKEQQDRENVRASVSTV